MITFDFSEIEQRCSEFGLELDDNIKNKLTVYGNMLVDWNEKINLTAITDPDGILYKHFLDCLLFFKAYDIPQNASVIDVGTGAGFPGMVLKIVRPDINLTLLDGLNKRLIFLREVLKELEISADTVHLRAEDAGKNPLYREKFDVATARAVAALPVLSEYCLPFVKTGGMFIAMKGSSGKEELEIGENAIKILGGQTKSLTEETLTGEEKRTFIKIKKISQTPPKYPRSGGKIAKSAL